MNDETYMLADYAPVIGIFAEDRAGKDTAAQYLVDNHDFMRVAFADRLKECLLVLNPQVQVSGHGTKHLQDWYDQISDENGNVNEDWLKDNCPEYRDLLKRFGTKLMREHMGMDSIWVDYLRTRLKSFESWYTAPSGIVIPDVREEAQARMIIEELDGYVIELRSDYGQGHYASDEEVAEIRDLCSYTLTNDYQVEDLYAQLDSMVKAIGQEYSDDEYIQEGIEYDCD